MGRLLGIASRRARRSRSRRIYGWIPTWLSIERVAEMLSSVDHFAGTTLEEADAVTSTLNLGPVGIVGEADSHGASPQIAWQGLTEEELVAANDAAQLEHWSVDETINVLRRATVERSRVGTRRLTLITAADWIAFAQS
jgi:hypothetical protein